MSANDQAVCLDAKNNVVVHACAGSGKTWLLVSRIVRILLGEPSTRLPSILAITFTEDAAREIQERVGERLREMMEADGDRLDEILASIDVKADDAVRETARSLYRRYVMARPQLSVHTFHGWFARLVEHMPWGAAAVVSGRVDEGSGRLRAEAWEKTLVAAAQGGGHGKALEKLLGIAKLATIKDMLDSMLENRLDMFLYFGLSPEDECMPERFMAKLEEAMPRPDGPDPVQLMSHGDFIKALYKAVNLLDLTKKGHMNVKQGIDDALILSEGGPYKAYLRLRGALYTKAGSKRKALDPDLWSDVFGFVDTAEEVKNWVFMREFNELAINLGHAYAREVERAKERNAMFEFSDLEMAPLRHLIEVPADGGTAKVSEGAIANLASRMDFSYRHILVDEFQDTSPPQWLLLRAWLAAMAHGDNRPSVMIVGDPKQSIYSFRAGNPRLLKTATHFVRQTYNGTEVRLNTTRRCSATVTAVVNKLFSGDPQEDGMPDFQEHGTMAEDGTGQVVVHDLVELEKEDDGQDPGELRNPLLRARKEGLAEDMSVEEGRRIARALKNQLGGGEVGSWVGDVMLLVRDRVGADSLVKGISAEGVHCAVPGGGNRLAALECRDMVALLRSIYDPAYGLAVAHVLRSPVFAVTEDDLWAVHEAGRNDKGHCDWVAGLRRAKGSDALGRAQELLNSWRRAYTRGKLPSHEMLATCFHEGDIVARYARAVPLEIRRRVVQNLEWVLNLAIEAEGGHLAQVSDFSRWMAGNFVAAPKAPAQPGVLNMMTVHNAKGLESPVVVLADADFKSPNKRARLLTAWDLDERDDRPAHVSFVSSDKRATKAQQEYIGMEEQADELEKKNLLYVAMTRARDLLLVSARSKKLQDSNWHEAVRSAVEGLGADKTAGGISVGEAGKAAGERPDARGEALLELPGDGTGGGGHGTRRTRYVANARRGALLHNLLAARLAGMDDRDKQRRLLAVSREEFDEIGAAADQIMSGSDFASLLVGCDAAEAELPLIDADGRLGRIDCLVQRGDETWVVDFKTGEKADPDRHRGQLRRYAGAVAGWPGARRTVRAALVGADGELEVLDL